MDGSMWTEGVPPSGVEKDVGLEEEVEEEVREDEEEEERRMIAPRRYKLAILSWESIHSVVVGSVGVHVTFLAEALARRGHEVHVFVRLGPNDLPPYEDIDGVHYHRIEAPYNPDFVAEVSALVCVERPM